MIDKLLCFLSLSMFNTFLFAQPCTMTLTATVNNAMGGAPNGTITINIANGTAPYTFLWSSGETTQNIEGLGPGTYSVAVTDSAGCTASVSANVINLTGPTILANSYVVSSYQVVDGGFTPQWVCADDTLDTDGGIMKIYLESGATMITGGGIDTVYAKTGSTIVMSGGIHVIYHETGVNLVMNGGIPTLHPCLNLVFNYSQAPANGCSSIPECDLSTDVSINNISCFGQSSGSATVNPIGGTAPYTYAWSPVGAASQTVNNLPSGEYTVLVTDALNCTSIASVTITEPPALSVVVSSTNEIMGMDGTATATVSGGTPEYTYFWTPGGATTSSVDGLLSGTYTVEVLDANGCGETVEVQVGSQVSLEEWTLENVSFFPNPTQENCYVSLLNTHLTDAKVIAYSMDGKEMFSQAMNDLPLLEISMKDWSKGIYLVSIHAGTGVVQRSIVKQ
jgi:hypothetical protein